MPLLCCIGLSVGTYTIHELAGAKNKGYVLAADKTVSVKSNLVAPVIAAFVMVCAAGVGAFEFYRGRRKKSQN